MTEQEIAALAVRIHELKSNYTQRGLCELMIIKGLDFTGKESNFELAMKLAVAESSNFAPGTCPGGDKEGGQ